MFKLASIFSLLTVILSTTESIISYISGSADFLSSLTSCFLTSTSSSRLMLGALVATASCFWRFAFFALRISRRSAASSEGWVSIILSTLSIAFLTPESSFLCLPLTEHLRFLQTTRYMLDSSLRVWRIWRC